MKKVMLLWLLPAQILSQAPAGAPESGIYFPHEIKVKKKHQGDGAVIVVHGLPDKRMQKDFNLLLADLHRDKVTDEEICIHEPEWRGMGVLTIYTTIDEDYWMDGSMAGHGSYFTSYHLVTGEPLRFEEIFKASSREAVRQMALDQIARIYDYDKGCGKEIDLSLPIVTFDGISFATTCDPMSNYQRSSTQYINFSWTELEEFLNPGWMFVPEPGC